MRLGHKQTPDRQDREATMISQEFVLVNGWLSFIKCESVPDWMIQKQVLTLIGRHAKTCSLRGAVVDLPNRLKAVVPGYHASRTVSSPKFMEIFLFSQLGKYRHRPNTELC